MNAEAVARRFERRQGYELIDYAPVALPLYRLTVDAVTMVHRDIAPIKEFVLRAVMAGLNSPSAVAGFLGLERAIVDGTLAQLSDDRYLVAASEGEGSISVLDRGREVIARARESSPQDETLVFIYDRLLRKPVQLSTEQIIAPMNVNPKEMIEIRPYPAEGPLISDLVLADVLLVLQQQAGGAGEFARDLLKLKRIIRRLRVYRPAVALVYKKVRSADLQIGFVVDDVRDEALEHAFAVSGGPKKMGFIRSVDESVTAAELKRVLGPAVQRLLPEAAALNEKRLAVSIARLKYQAAISRAERRGTLKGLGALQEREAITSADAALSEAETDLRAFPARPVMPYELAELFEQALASCKGYLRVSCYDLANAINPPFARALEGALARGVRVTIRAVETDSASKSAVALERLRRKFPSLLLLEFGTVTVAYHLVWDSAYALICNRPVLGNRHKVRTFQQTVGYLLQRQDLVEAFVERIAAQRQQPKR